MRQTSFTEIIRTLALLLLGLLLGAGITSMVIGKQVDYLTMTNKELQNQLADQEYQLQKLKDNINATQNPIITAIEVTLTPDSLEKLSEYQQLHVQLAVSEKIKEWLNPLIGQELNHLDHLLIPRVVDDRIVEAENNSYRIQSQLIIMDQTIHLYVNAIPVKDKIPGQ